MKLLIIITHQKNTKQLEEEFIKQKIQFTKMETTGGFLRKKNYTYFVGIEDNKVESILQITKKTCRSQDEIAESPWFVEGQPGEVVIPEGQTKVKVGGATIFVTNTDKFVKI
ncbi:MAG: cyclic-di-AMP receptor [Parcubacteria group bacterium]|nr:cyclic-di-AMP receptor [Parcubacteria group bacterium]